jgi:hypothetical protein
LLIRRNSRVALDQKKGKLCPAGRTSEGVGPIRAPKPKCVRLCGKNGAHASAQRL